MPDDTTNPCMQYAYSILRSNCLHQLSSLCAFSGVNITSEHLSVCIKSKYQVILIELNTF